MSANSVDCIINFSTNNITSFYDMQNQELWCFLMWTVITSHWLPIKQSSSQTNSLIQAVSFILQYVSRQCAELTSGTICYPGTCLYKRSLSPVVKYHQKIHSRVISQCQCKVRDTVRSSLVLIKCTILLES